MTSTTSGTTAEAGPGGSPAVAPDDEATVHDAARAVAAVAMLGAGVIHFAFAPDHMAEQTSHGVFFLAVAWLQLAAAAAVGLSWQPRRGWLLGTAALNTGVAALWLWTRTLGLPGDEPEPVGLGDSVASGLEIVAAGCALALALGWLAERPVRRPPAIVTGLPAVVVVGVVTASVVPALGGGHGHDVAEAAGGHEAAATSPASAGGHGQGTAPAADGDWDARRVAALAGYLPDDEVARLRQLNMDYLAEQIRGRSRTLGDLPDAEREARIAEFVEWSVDNALLAENGSATGDEPTMHSHGITPWQDLADPDDQRALQTQLRTAGTVIAPMATAADALDAGYIQVTPYVPGIGAHYLNIDLLQGDGFDPARPEMLLYNGNETTSVLVGFSYAVLAEDPPEGFVGPNDQWHVHPSLCIVGTLVVGPDSTPEDMCASIGGRKGMGFDHPMWMAHLWQVPGWESSWGLFSGENPVVNLATTDVGR